MSATMENLSPITHADLKSDRIRHGFYGRTGGVSDGIYKGLNCGVGSNDATESVLENRRRLVFDLTNSNAPLITPYQIHSAACVAVNGPWENEEAEQCDALATATPGIVIAVGTADCGPVLFTDRKAGVIAAAHSGWKGAVGGVLESTIAVMEKLGADRANISAVLGPTISQASYEVGTEFRNTFLEQTPANATYFKNGRDDTHFQFNLPAYVVNRLQACGISNANWTGQCTYLEETAYFSYRRTTHRNEPDYGRQLAAISII
ncbi:MAG: peptidoglycan editing factor PgeF [Hyphomicrobiales bacterium]